MNEKIKKYQFFSEKNNLIAKKKYVISTLAVAVIIAVIGILMTPTKFEFHAKAYVFQQPQLSQETFELFLLERMVSMPLTSLYYDNFKEKIVSIANDDVSLKIEYGSRAGKSGFYIKVKDVESEKAKSKIINTIKEADLFATLVFQKSILNNQESMNMMFLSGHYEGFSEETKILGDNTFLSLTNRVLNKKQIGIAESLNIEEVMESNFIRKLGLMTITFALFISAIIFVLGKPKSDKQNQN